jgi:hypothetical protein
VKLLGSVGLLPSCSFLLDSPSANDEKDTPELAAFVKALAKLTGAVVGVGAVMPKGFAEDWPKAVVCPKAGVIVELPTLPAFTLLLALSLLIAPKLPPV